MRRVAKIAGIILLVLMVAGLGIRLLFPGIGPLGLLRSGSGSVSDEPTASTAEVARGSIEEIVSASGNVAADREITLAFRTSGLIAELLVGEGQQAEAGELLARLDTASLEWQIARSRASLATAGARLEQVRKPPSEEELASARAALDSALANYEEVKEGASVEDLDSAQAALDSAQANYEKVKAGPTTEDLAAAKAALDSARAALQQAQAIYDRVKDRPDAAMLPESLALQNATIDAQRAQAAYDALANHPTASELAAARAQVSQARAQLAGLQQRPRASQLAAAAAQVAQAEAQLAQLQSHPSPEDVAVVEAQVEEAAIALEQALDQRADAELRAPFDATVLQVLTEEGEWVSPGGPAFVLADTGGLVLDVNVDEVDVAQLAVGQQAYLSLDALRGAEIRGSISEIAPSAKSVGGIVAYAVKVGFMPGDLPVRLGMTADVDVVVASAEDVLLVPNRAIEADRDAGRYYVVRLSRFGTEERIEVLIGLRDENRTQILEGLEEGDQVLLPEVPGQSEDSSGFVPGHRVFGGGED